MSPIRTYLMSRIRSFGYAFKGIATLFRTQANAQIHLLAVVVISLLGWYLGINAIEWCIILICMALVLVTEGVNTAIEFLTDLVSPEPHPLAGKAKDVAAGAVLISVIFCGIVWGIIFLPRIFAIFGL
ncbi:MAG: diacylglycerol kinase family protein [Bacteroidia bacterium]